MLKSKSSKQGISILLVLALAMINFTLSVFVPNTVNAAAQATYYVSPAGSDSNDGSLSYPFQTITKARDVVRTINSNMTGDIIVNLMGGTYGLTSQSC